MPGTSRSVSGRRAVLLAVMASLATAAIAIGFPSGAISADHGTTDSAPLSMLGPWGWITAQAFLLTTPGILVALLPALSTRLSRPISTLLILGVPALVLADTVAFRWIGNHFLSDAMWRIATELLPGLAGHITGGMIISLGGLMLAFLLSCVAGCWAAERVSRDWLARRRLPGPWAAWIGCTLLAVIAATPFLLNTEAMRRGMEQDSTRHPFCVVGIVRLRQNGEDQVGGNLPPGTPSIRMAITRREHQQRLLDVDADRSNQQPPPDVLIVVVESFRQELVAPDVMPHLWRHAQTGIHCQKHFSGGNATTHGMFSLLCGLEAIWYERPVRYSPLLSRLFQSAGYEIGFFAGHDDWRKFYMDGFISEDHFNVFETSQPDGLASDRRAVELASMFLERRDLTESDEARPRLAPLYLYATHATYRSYSEDQVFSPAADDRLLYPYSPSARPQVWNRYLNSARTIDRFLGSVLREDRINIVTGDHGEAFLEDGTIGHGIRISQYQNMTPAVVSYPGGSPRRIDQPTFHADLLPTLLSAAGIPVNHPTSMDGLNLLTASTQELANRMFVTRNYLEDDAGLIGPWTGTTEGPFCYRIRVSLVPTEIRGTGAINLRGEATPNFSQFKLDGAVQQWLLARFGPACSEDGSPPPQP